MRGRLSIIRSVLLPTFSVEILREEVPCSGLLGELESRVVAAGGSVSKQSEHCLNFRLPMKSLLRRPSIARLAVSVRVVAADAYRVRLTFLTARRLHTVFVGVFSIIALGGALEARQPWSLLLIPLAMAAGHIAFWREWGLSRRHVEKFLMQCEPSSDLRADAREHDNGVDRST